MTRERGEALEGASERYTETYDVSTTVILTGVSTACLVRYERARIVAPARVGRRRVYRASDLKRIRKAHRLEQDLGVNLPGVEVILRLTEQLEELQRRLAEHEGERTRAG